MTSTVGRLRDGDFLLAGELDERIPRITNNLEACYPLDGTPFKYLPSQVRYIRDWVFGNSTNTSSHWVEIQAIDFNSANIALNKNVTTRPGSTMNPGHITSLSLVVDGDTNSSNFIDIADSGVAEYIQVDLGGLYSVNKVVIWHYYLNSRTYHNTKTEVSQDGVHWVTIFDSIIEGEYAETPSGHTMDLINLGITAKLSSYSVNSLDYNGYVCEIPTTNVLSNPLFIDSTTGQASSSGWNVVDWSTGTLNTSNVVMDIDQNGNLAPLYKLTRGATADNTIMIAQTLNITGIVSSQCWVKSLSISDITIQIYDGITWKVGGTAKAGQWTFIKIDGHTAGSVSPPNFRIRPDLGQDESVLIGYPQFEQNAFTTSFVNGTRAYQGSGTITFRALQPSYSVRFKHKPKIPHSYIVANTKTSSIIHIGSYNTNPSISLMNVNGNLTLNIKGNTGTSWSVNQTLFSFNNSTWDNVEHDYTIVVVDSNNLNVYMDSTLLGRVNSTVAFNSFATNTMNLNLSDSTYQSNATFKDISIYNKAISTSDVKILTNDKFQLNNIGNLLVGSFSEKSSIPTDAYYFPLAIDSSNDTKIFAPNSENNTVYNGSIWIGSSTTNLVYNVGATNLSTATDLNSVTTKTLLGNGVYSLINNGAALTKIRLYCNISDLINGNSYSYQINFMQNKGTISIIWNGTTIATSNESYGVLSGTFNSATYDSTNNYIELNLNAGGRVVVYGEQIENRKFVTAFTPSARGTSNLEFNFYRDLHLDWSGNWTIAYWKMPTGTSNGTDLTDYSIESLGANTGSAGYIWWGKTTGANNVSATATTFTQSTAFTPSNYFGVWNMVSVVKSGTIVKYTFHNLEGFDRVGATTINVTSADWYVTPNGYDFKLGGFDHTNTCNGYFRDLIVVKRALTDSELAAMLKKQMKVGQNTFQISNSINETSL